MPVNTECWTKQNYSLTILGEKNGVQKVGIDNGEGKIKEWSPALWSSSWKKIKTSTYLESPEITMQECYLEKWVLIPKQAGKWGEAAASGKEEMISGGRRTCCVSQSAMEKCMHSTLCTC